MNNAFHAVKTSKLPLTGASSDLMIDAQGSHLRIWSDRSFHFKVGGTATTGDTPVSAEHAELIPCPAEGETIHFIKAAGETDGSVWVSHVKLV
jgi:hypothetical protein